MRDLKAIQGFRNFHFMGKRLLLVLLLISPFLASAQQKEEKPATNGVVVGVFGHSFGFGLDLRYLAFRGDWDYTFGLSFSSYKNPKELKVASAYADQGGKNFIFDKLNYGYVLAPTFGISRKIIPRQDHNRIGVSVGISGGPIFALLKPYYLQIAVPFGGNQAIVEVERYSPFAHNYTNIYGVADYFLGMNEITVMPGARLKLSSMVDFSAGSDYIRGVELGIFADYFAKKLPLLGFTPNRQFFLGGSIEILIGNTW